TGVHMAGPSTRRALNDRAWRIADWLHDRAKDLEQMHNITVLPEDLRDGWSGSITRDGGPGMVTLKINDLKNLILTMDLQKDELRRFGERPQTKLRRI